MTERPNILFLMTDQQQASTVDPGSPCDTPALDQLAREGVRFTRAYTVNAICSPSRASLFSGVLPSFLATQMALENANFETSARLNIGAPVSIRVFQRWNEPEDPESSRLKPSFLTKDLTAVPGIEQSVGLTYNYASRAADPAMFALTFSLVY